MKKCPFIKRMIPIGFLLFSALLIYLLDLHKYLSFQELKTHRKTLQIFVSKHRFLSPFIYILIYAVLTALSIPGGAFFSVIGGFLFPQPFSTLYVVSGASLGASLLFLSARYAFSNYLKKKMGSWLKKVSSGLKKKPFSYLFFLRLVPIFPFWFVNLAPALLGVFFFPFFLTTFLGIIPGSFVYTQAGRGLGSAFDSEEDFSLTTFLNPQIRIALFALGAFALLPIILKKLWKND